MGIGRIFSKVGKAVWTGIRHVDIVGDALEKIPGGKDLLLLIPIAGPVAKIVLDEVNWAEQVFPGPGTGKDKLALAIKRVLERIETYPESAGGVVKATPKEVETAIEAVLLAKKGYAELGEPGE